jgi:hypothetical protein
MEESVQLHAKDALTPGEREALTHCIGGRMGPQTRSEYCENKQFLAKRKPALSVSKY